MFFAVIRRVTATPVIFYTRVTRGRMQASSAHSTPVFSYTRVRAGLHSRRARLSGLVALGLAVVLTGLVASLVQPATASAATNNTLTFQARLTQPSGAIVDNGNYNIEFRLYNAKTGSSSLWVEDYLNSADNGVKVANGYLNVNLGSTTPFPAGLSWDQDLYITMNIGGTSISASPGWDGEMNPRLHLTAVPYAFQAKSASQLQVTSGAATSTLSFANPSNSNNILLPDASGTLCLAGSSDCGFAAATGGSGYIQNGSTIQPNTNFAIQSSSSTAATGVIQALNGQTGDLLQFRSSSGKVLSAINSSGGLTLGAGTDFVNNGSTTLGSEGSCAAANTVLNATLVASTTVDVCSYLTFTQTTPGITVAIPEPTKKAAGRLVYLTNTGSSVLSVKIGSSILPLSTHGTTSILWDGSAWTFSGTSYASVTSQTGEQVGSTTGTGIVLQSAGASNAGLVDTSDQTFAGNKTLTGSLSVTLAPEGSTQTVCLASGATATTGTLTGCAAPSTGNYAERYPVASGAIYGDIVATGTKLINTYTEVNGTVDWTQATDKISQLVKTTATYQQSSIGVLVNNYGNTTSNGNNIKSSDNPMSVALSGRVSVSIAADSAAIAPGDYITTSITAGKGMKATAAGYVIGKALASWDPASGDTSVMVFVEPGQYDGPNMSQYVQNGGNATLVGLTVSGTADFADLNASGHATISDLTVMNATVSGNLTVTGLTSVVDLQISGHLITSGTAPTVAAADAAGDAASCTVTGNDTSGQISITTGTKDWQNGAQCQLTFAKAFASSPHPVIALANGAGAMTDSSSVKPYIDASPTGFQILFNSPDTAVHTYVFNYFNAQ